MKRVLVINSSARAFISRSRKLTEIFVDHWKNIHVNPLISFRELGNQEVPHLTDSWISAAFKPLAIRSEQDIDALRVSDMYISELRAADIIVIGAPMYNWSIPSALKAYVDQILRVNETFKVNTVDVRHPYVGMLADKTLFLLLSRGDEGYGKGEYNEHMDFQSPYLKTVFNIMGIRDIHMFAISGRSPDAIETSTQDLRMLIEQELVLSKIQR